MNIGKNGILIKMHGTRVFVTNIFNRAKI
jgi:hypothetical protein